MGIGAINLYRVSWICGFYNNRGAWNRIPIDMGVCACLYCERKWRLLDTTLYNLRQWGKEGQDRGQL